MNPLAKLRTQSEELSRMVARKLRNLLSRKRKEEHCFNSEISRVN